MNTWKKIGDDWCVVCPEPHKNGDVVTVTNRAGESKQATLARLVQSARWGDVWTVEKQARPAQAELPVGSMSGILELFGKAKTHLKRPAIVLSVPELDMALRLNVAGARAKVPGSVTVLDNAKVYDPTSEWGSTRDWLGRITVEGTYQPSRSANGRTDAIVRRLTQFAAEPAKVAAEHGRLTGSCCFCNRTLKDERSTAVGYGETCAGHYGLPWGSQAQQTGMEGR